VHRLAKGMIVSRLVPAERPKFTCFHRATGHPSVPAVNTCHSGKAQMLVAKHHRFHQRPNRFNCLRAHQCPILEITGEPQQK